MTPLPGRSTSVPGRWPRWLLVYLVLAAVNLLAVTAGIVLQSELTGSYAAALENSRQMTELRDEIVRLGEAAAQVDAPGNDIFLTRDARGAAVQLDDRVARYVEQSAMLRHRLSSGRDADPALAVAIAGADSAMSSVIAEARRVIASFPTDVNEATRHMAAMDRSHERFSVAYRRAQVLLAHQQRAYFDAHFRRAASLQHVERAIAIATFLIVLALLFYGRQLNSGLEQRVNERTAEMALAVEAMAASDERFRLLARATQDVLWDWNLATDSVWHSEALHRLTGEAPMADRRSDWWFERIHHEDLPRHRAAVARALDGTAAGFDAEYRLRRADGGWAVVRDRGFVIRDAGGTPVRIVGSVMDITQARAAAEAQAEQRAFLRQVIDTIPNFVFVKDRDGRFTLVNQALAEAYGTTVSDLIGKGDADFNADAAEVEHFRKLDIETMDTRSEVFIPEERITTHDGAVRWLQTVKRPIAGADGVANQILGISTDITARRQAKEALVRLASIVESSDDAICSVDPNGIIESWNTGAERLFGYAAADVMGRSLSILKPDDAPATDLLDAIRRGERVRQLERTARRRDGTMVQVALTISPLAGQAGEVAGASVIARDVTDRRRSEAGMAEAQRIARIGSWERDLATGRVHWSDETYRHFGLEPRSVEPSFELFMSFVHPDDRSTVIREVQANAESRESFGFVTRYVRADGSVSTYMNRVRFEGEEGRPATRLRGTAQDITEQEAVEGELRRAQQQSEAASRAKSDFLANMSHEIRTPMNGVLGMLELALDSSLTAEQRDYLQTAHGSADALLAVINDILDFSKIEAGRLELDPMPFDLGVSLGETVSTLALRAHEKELELAMEIAPDVPERLVGDLGRLRQVLVNLLGNAIKFTASGEVVLRISLAEPAERASGSTTVLRFDVNDTGIGIAPGKQAMIFEAFLQADTSTTREFGGTGLGLAISSRLVALMGGAITVRSTPGAGSTFSFTARFEQPGDADRAPDEGEVDLHDVAVLIVDDNATNLRIIEQMTRRWGMRPTPVSSGHAALEAAERACAAGHPFQLVLTDADMPGMDGFELVTALRARPELQAPSVLMLSSARHREEVARCRQLGVKLYLTKPIAGARLRDAIRRGLGAGDPVRVIPAARARQPGRSLSILLAEDNPVNQKLAVSVLQLAGHRVDVVGTGREAVARSAAVAYDALLMDVQMPDMGGLEATRLIRAREQERGGRVPIIALTARAMQGDRELCLAAGMDGYISKPLRRSELLLALVTAIAGTPEITDGHPAGPPRAAEVDAIATDSLMESIGGDRTLLAELVTIFAADAPARVAELRAAARSKDAEAVRFAAHTLKGASASMGAVEVAALARRLEAQGADDYPTDVEAVVAEVEDALARAIARLRALGASAEEEAPPAAGP